MSVSANAVAAHLIQVAKALHDKKFERQVCMQGRTLLQQMSDKSLLHPFTEEEILGALQKTKPATTPGYDNIHVEFLKKILFQHIYVICFHLVRADLDSVINVSNYTHYFIRPSPCYGEFVLCW